MSEKVNKKTENKNANKLILGLVLVFFFVFVGVSGLWYVKSGAFKDVVLNALDKNGGVIKTVQLGQQRINLTEAIVLSKLNMIKRSGYPFNPGVTIDADITLSPKADDVYNQSLVSIPLKGLKIENSLFSTSDLSIWLPKFLNVKITSHQGLKFDLTLENKAMLLKMIGLDDASEIQLQALDLKLSVGNKENMDKVSMASLGVVIKTKNNDHHSVFNAKKVKINFSDKKEVNFKNISYKGDIKNRLLMNDIETQRLLSVFQASPNDLEVLRGLIHKMAEASISGTLDINISGDNDSSVSIQSYMDKDNKDKDNMAMQAIVTTQNLKVITQSLITLGVSKKAIEFTTAMFHIVAKKIDINGAERLELVAKYKDYRVTLNDKEIMNINTKMNKVDTSTSSSLKE